MGAAIGAATGALGGLFGQQKEGGTDAGNAYGGAYNAAGGAAGLGNTMNGAMTGLQSYTGDPTQQLQNNSILGGIYGKGGTFDQTNQEAQDLAKTGYALTPEDHTAYGQASGNIARMFGQSDQSMSQALSDRGLSNSGVAGAMFTGSQGNKQEQLAGLQTKIANDRMNMNMQRLGQTRNFLSQLSQQGAHDIGQMQDMGIQKANSNNEMQQQKYNMANGILGNYQGQQNEGLMQQQQTQHASPLSAALGGAISGGMAGMAGGGMSPAKPTMSGQSYGNNSNGSGMFIS